MIYRAIQLIQIFSAGPATGPASHGRGSEVVQEVLADLKITLYEPIHVCLHFLALFMSGQLQDQHHLDYEFADCQDHSHDCLHPQLQQDDK